MRKTKLNGKPPLRGVIGIISTVTLAILSLFIVGGIIEGLLQANVQEFAKQHQLDTFLVNYWGPTMAALEAVLASRLFWGAFGFFAGTTLIVWLIRLSPTMEKYISISPRSKLAFYEGEGQTWSLPEVIARRVAPKELVQAWEKDGLLETNTEGYRQLANCLRKLLLDGRVLARGKMVILLDNRGTRTVEKSYTDLGAGDWQRLALGGQYFSIAVPQDGNFSQFVALEFKEAESVTW